MVEKKRFVSLRSLFRIIILSLTLSLTAPGYCDITFQGIDSRTLAMSSAGMTAIQTFVIPDEAYQDEFGDPSLNSNRGGNVNVGGSMTLSSMLGSTTLGFGSSHGAGGSTTTLHSTFTPPSMQAAAAMIGSTGIDPHQVAPQMNPLLMLHGFNAQNIHLLTQPRGAHATQIFKPFLVPALKEAAVVGAAIAAKIGLDGTAKLLERRDRSGAAAATGNMPDPDDDGEGDDKWQREPQSLQDEMALQEAKNGSESADHTRIFRTLDDPKFKGMEKWQVKVKSANGKDSVVHYVRDPKTGARMDFKFKKSSID